MIANSSRRRLGFTLIELLVVIGIIALLIAIAFPVIGRAIANGKRARTQADMSMIQTALEEYKKDHGGRYPQSEGLNSGFAVLARELVGVYGDGQTGNPSVPDPNDPPPLTGPAKPGDAVMNGGNSYVAMYDMSVRGALPPTDKTAWAQVNCHDYADGPGTRITLGGKKVTYIPSDRFRVRGCALLDGQDNPILYFPAHGNPNINRPLVSGGASYVAAAPAPPAEPPKFDANDNVQFFTRQPPADAVNSTAAAIKRIQAMLGDFAVEGGTGAPSFNGIIDGKETAVVNGSYVLWAPGPDGFYGCNVSEAELGSDPAKIKRTIEKCDDILLSSP